MPAPIATASRAIPGRASGARNTSLVGKFLFDISKPITDYGGEIYLYKGDGLIAIWDWREAVRNDKILRALDAVFAAVQREQGSYTAQFGVVPTFRIGVHGGDVVVSEQGDTKRSIGIYGSTINIASRMEEAAKAHGVACAISGDVAQVLAGAAGHLRPIGSEKVKGITERNPDLRVSRLRYGQDFGSEPLAFTISPQRAASSLETS